MTPRGTIFLFYAMANPRIVEKRNARPCSAILSGIVLSLEP